MKKMMLALVAISVGLFWAGSAPAAENTGPVDFGPFEVRAHIANICQVTANNLNFTPGVGTTLEVSAVPYTATTSLLVTCTKGTQYRVGMGAGENYQEEGGSNLVRQMQRDGSVDGDNDADDYLAYTLRHETVQHIGSLESERWGTQKRLIGSGGRPWCGR